MRATPSSIELSRGARALEQESADHPEDALLVRLGFAEVVLAEGDIPLRTRLRWSRVAGLIFIIAGVCALSALVAIVSASPKKTASGANAAAAPTGADANKAAPTPTQTKPADTSRNAASQDMSTATPTATISTPTDAQAAGDPKPPSTKTSTTKTAEPAPTASSKAWKPDF